MFNSTVKISRILLDIVEVTFVGVAVFFLTYLFIGQPLEITGNSMYPTLHDKEQIIAEKISGKINHGDIVVFKHPEHQDVLIIKRVIALPGETLKISNGQVFVNSILLEEGYVSQPTNGDQKLMEETDYTLPAEHYALFGDNRAESIDSRNWGFIHKENIVGKSFIVYYPLNKLRVSDSNVGIENLGKKLAAGIKGLFSPL